MRQKFLVGARKIGLPGLAGPDIGRFSDGEYALTDLKLGRRMGQVNPCKVWALSLAPCLGGPYVA